MELILGTVQMGIDYGVNNRNGRISSKDSLEILSAAFDAGIHQLDTAETYGNAHQLIGNFHKLNPGKRFNVVTKVPKNIDVSLLEERIYEYVTVLNVRTLGVLMFHDFDTYCSSKLGMK